MRINLLQGFSSSHYVKNPDTIVTAMVLFVFYICMFLSAPFPAPLTASAACTAPRLPDALTLLPDALYGLIAGSTDIIFSNQCLLLYTLFTLILALVRIAIHSCSACHFIPFYVSLNMLQKSKRCSTSNSIFYDDIYRLFTLSIFSSDPGALVIFFDNYSSLDSLCLRSWIFGIFLPVCSFVLQYTHFSLCSSITKKFFTPGATIKNLWHSGCSVYS